MSQRASGSARIPDENYTTIEEWPVRALHAELPAVSAWDPCPGDGMPLKHLQQCGVRAVGTDHDFFSISEPPLYSTDLVDTIDMPVSGSGAKARVDGIAAADWIKAKAPAVAFCERAQAWPGQGASFGFSYGRSAAAIETVVALCAVPLTLVEAGKWKRKLHLPGKDKEAARQRALQLFPAQHALLARKRDHGRAEAALLVVASLVQS
jgi:crossover junction endodeoxyribonuclease RuvC